MLAPRSRLPLIVVLVASQAALGLALSRCLMRYRDTLEGSGRWIATKATLSRAVMGAQSFQKGRQSVEKQRLNLGAWFGYQEVLYHRPVALTELDFEFLLYPDAYVNIVFDKTERGFAGVRISLNERFPSQFFTASAEGEYRGRTALTPPPLRPREWNRAKAVFAADGLSVSVNGQEAGRVPTPFPHEQVFGFRGGRRIALVRDVAIREGGADPLRPGYTIHESFAGAGAAGLAVLSLLAVAAANGGALLLARLASSNKIRVVALGMVVANGVAAVLALLILGYLALTAGRYPVLDHALRRSEEAWRETTAEEVRARIGRRYGKEPPPGTRRRILFLGSSQTWGAGASQAGETFVEVAERRLNEGAAASARYECINGGISAADSTLLLDLLEKEWLDLRPAVVVINLGNNDGDTALLASNVETMARLALAAGTRPILVLEPNTTEDPASDQTVLRANHEALRQVGQRLGLPVVDMHEHLAALADRGFLWWDSVHLTSFGQRLFAERLAGVIEQGGAASRPPDPPLAPRE